MKSTRVFGCAFAVLLLSSVPSSKGQQAAVVYYRVVFHGAVAPRTEGIKNAPYSAEQTLQDFPAEDAPPTQTNHERSYRDGQGRWRVDRPIANSHVWLVQIIDPVAGYQYVIDNVAKVAHRVAAPAIPNENSAPQTSPSVTKLSWESLHNEVLNWIPKVQTAEIFSESLGSRVLDGVSVQGFRKTITYPALAVGNANVITVVTEAWVSEERKLIMLSRRDDPLHGHLVSRTFNYTPGEPDPSLFLPPPGYTIVDEQGTWRIDIPVPIAIGPQ